MEACAQLFYWDYQSHLNLQLDSVDLSVASIYLSSFFVTTPVHLLNFNIDERNSQTLLVPDLPLYVQTTHMSLKIIPFLIWNDTSGSVLAVSKIVPSQADAQDGSTECFHSIV